MVTEDWMSGLNQQFTKLPKGKTFRGFESHILRKLTSNEVATIICQCKTMSFWRLCFASARNKIRLD